MNFLSWNCRELENPQIIHELHLLVKTKITSLVFLIETKCGSDKLERVCIKPGFEFCLRVDGNSLVELTMISYTS